MVMMVGCNCFVLFLNRFPGQTFSRSDCNDQRPDYICSNSTFCHYRGGAQFVIIDTTPDAGRKDTCLMVRLIY